MCPPPPFLIAQRGKSVRQPVRCLHRSFTAPVQECSRWEQVGCWTRCTILLSLENQVTWNSELHRFYLLELETPRWEWVFWYVSSHLLEITSMFPTFVYFPVSGCIVLSSTRYLNKVRRVLHSRELRCALIISWTRTCLVLMISEWIQLKPLKFQQNKDLLLLLDIAILFNSLRDWNLMAECLVLQLCQSPQLSTQKGKPNSIHFFPPSL